MAKRDNPAATIDWYLISIERLKQIGLVVVILLLAGAGYWFWREQKGNPKSNAESAIADARQALNSLAASNEFNAHRAEFNRAQQKLDEAKSHFTATRYAEAQSAAVETQTIVRTAVSGPTENDAQFLAVEGDVKVQKAAASDWHDADTRTPLYNGDWVKTGDHSSAELIFSSNGSLYTIGSNALLEIYATLNPGSTRKSNSVTVKVGPVEVATSNDTSTVRTPGTQVVVESESTTQVGVDNNTNATSVVAMRGSASVSPEQGGAGVRLSSGEKVTSTPVGAVSPVKKVALAPALQSPADNQVFQLSPELMVQFLWEPQSGATGYVLQVSRSRLFSTQEINSRRTKTTASAKVTAEGAFYWRVASIGADGDIGPFSVFRRFRVAGGNRMANPDNKPPQLLMRKPFLIGSQYYVISGTTEPGATVFINDEEVDVGSNGFFQKLVGFGKLGQNTVVIKAVDAAGNTNVQNQTVIVQE